MRDFLAFLVVTSVTILVMLAGATLTSCGGLAPGVPTSADKDAYAWNQATCLASNTNLADVRTCVRSVREDYCARFPNLDTCPKDGGHE